MKASAPLTRDFFDRHVVDVARDLPGHLMQFQNHQGIITETEAYRGNDDPASHAYKRVTPRNRLMYGPPGILYVYLSYGMHFCMNLCAESEGQAAAVLIRGICTPTRHYNGPGKSTRYLGINKTHNGLDIIENQDMQITPSIPHATVLIGTRIGIRQGTDKPWRFTLEKHHIDTILADAS